MSQKQAASEGAGMVAMAVTASTLTTVAVFLPLVFVEGLAGQLLRDQALTISFSLLASLAVALTIVPTLAGLGGEGSHQTHGAVLPAAEGMRRQHQTLRSASRSPTALRYASSLLFLHGSSCAGELARPQLEPSVNVVLDRFHEGYESDPRLPGRAARSRPAWKSALSLRSCSPAIAIGFFLPRNLFPPFTQGEFTSTSVARGPGTAVTDATLERLRTRRASGSARSRVRAPARPISRSPARPARVTT